MPDIEVYGVTAEVPLVDSGFPRLRVRGVTAEAVTVATHPTEMRTYGVSAEVVLVKRPPPSWLPRYLFDGTYWIPLFPVAGTPNQGVGLTDDAPFTFRSPDGTLWQLSIDDTGALVTAPLAVSGLDIVSSSYGSLSMSGTGQQSIAKPLNLRPNDLMIAQVVHRASTGESTPPSDSDWTLLRRDKNPATVSSIDQWQEIWTRVATENEPSHYLWRFGGSMGAGITVVRNPAGSVEVEDHDHLATVSSDHSAPSVTAQGDGRLFLKFAHCVYAGGNAIGGWHSSQLGNSVYGGIHTDRILVRYGSINEGATGLNYLGHTISTIIPGSDHDGGTTSVLLRAE